MDASQGPSPDEVALAEGARQLGFEFVSRSSNGVVLSLQGTEARCSDLDKLAGCNSIPSVYLARSVVAQSKGFTKCACRSCYLSVSGGASRQADQRAYQRKSLSSTVLSLTHS